MYLNTARDTREDASQDGLLVEEMRDRIAYLERMLDQEREARTEERRRHDTLMQRLPELEAPADQRDAPETISEDSGNVR